MPTPTLTTRPTRVSPKGQVTIPKPVRDLLGIAAGSAVEFEITPAGEVLLHKRADSARPLRGLLRAHAPAQALSTGDMDEAARAEAARLDGESRGRGHGGGAGG